MSKTDGRIAQLLSSLASGDREMADELFEMVYSELKQIARRQRRRWHGDHTLHTTALVHEAYVKLSGGAQVEVDGRDHFHALAARAMRQILCNHARDRRAKKRGRDRERVMDGREDELVDQVESTGAEELETLIALDDALRRFEEFHPRGSRVVECRFFGGMSVEETARAIGVSPRSVKRDWSLAQAWLRRAVET